MKYIKSILNAAIINLLLIFSLCSCSNKSGNDASSEDSIRVKYYPQTPAFSSEVATLSINGMSQGPRLAVVSLQGLVNRDTARIYLKEQQSNWIFDLYKEKGYIKSEVNYASIFELLKNYKNYFKGVVVIDSTKSFTVNLASNIAGTEDRIIISPGMITMIKRHLGSDINIMDLRDFNFADATAAYLWYEQNILPKQTKTVLSVSNFTFWDDVFRDYLIEFKIPTFWLPGPKDADYSTEYENKIIELFKNTPANIPLGFWQSGKIGYKEFDGVKLAGKYGKFTTFNLRGSNYSFHSAVNSEQVYYKQEKARAKKFREYNPTKKYVALIMIESGDAPSYFQFAFNQRHWDDSARGIVPISYGITPSLRYFMPAVTKYIYESATENDFFFCSISGAGYCYPFEGYCDETSDPGKNKKEYFSMTAENMHYLDLDMLGIYTHIASRWTTEDWNIAKTYMEPMKGLKSIISGMHRTGYTGLDGNEILGNNITIHHTLTFWTLVKSFNWEDISKDDISVDFLENEIRISSVGGNFIQAMFYSWSYGPRRLKLLKDRLEAQGFEFVTLDEFDYLWRVSKGLENK